MRDRVRPPKELEEILDRLKDDGFFETKQKALMFAASVGYAIERKKGGLGQPIDTFGEGIRIEYFERPRDDRFVDLMAVAATSDLKVLAEESQSDRIEQFEKFAHSGLQELAKTCYRAGQDPMIGLLDMIDSFSDEDADKALPGLDAQRKDVQKLL